MGIGISTRKQSKDRLRQVEDIEKRRLGLVTANTYSQRLPLNHSGSEPFPKSRQAHLPLKNQTSTFSRERAYGLKGHRDSSPSSTSSSSSSSSSSTSSSPRPFSRPSPQPKISPKIRSWSSIKRFAVARNSFHIRTLQDEIYAQPILNACRAYVQRHRVKQCLPPKVPFIKVKQKSPKSSQRRLRSRESSRAAAVFAKVPTSHLNLRQRDVDGLVIDRSYDVTTAHQFLFL